MKDHLSTHRDPLSIIKALNLKPFKSSVGTLSRFGYGQIQQIQCIPKTHSVGFFLGGNSVIYNSLKKLPVFPSNTLQVEMFVNNNNLDGFGDTLKHSLHLGLKTGECSRSL